MFLVTDEDDCSVDPSSDLFTANPADGPLASFRCTRYGVFCDGALVSNDAPVRHQRCAPATPAQGGTLTDVEKYLQFFSEARAKGAVKNDPRDVVFTGIFAPPTPFPATSSSGSDLCGAGSSSCATLTQAQSSCQIVPGPISCTI